jgi:hypothetical protein
MRHLRLTLGLATSVCAFALAVTPAVAHEFTANVAGKLSGINEEPQNEKGEYVIGPNTQSLKLGAFKIHCDKVRTKGAVASGSSKTFATSIWFSKCWTVYKLGAQEGRLATHLKTPLAIEYHANGFVETGSELAEVGGAAVLKGGEAEIKVNTGVTAELKKSICMIKWPEQTLPVKAEKKPELEYSEVSFSNQKTPSTRLKKFPDGFQHSIVVSNTLIGIKYEFEEEKCEEYGKEDGPEGGGGTFTGTFPEVLAGGDFEYN